MKVRAELNPQILSFVSLATMRPRCCALFVLVALLVSHAAAEFNTGFARSQDGFSFLGKFCFGITPVASKEPAGSITVRIAIDTHLAPAPQDLHLLVYDDEPESWPALYNNPKMTCQEKMSKALLNVPVHFPTDAWIWEHQGLVFEHTRPRFWYAVLANCKRIDFLVYNLVWVNSAASSWQKEFSACLHRASFSHAFVFLCKVSERIR